MRVSIVGLLVVALLAGSTLVSAQGFGTQRVGSRQTVPDQGNDPIVLGPVLFSPGAQLSYDYFSNLFRVEGEDGGTSALVSRFRLKFVLPIHESEIELSYDPQYVISNDVDVFDNWEHFLNFRAKFLFSSGLTVEARYSFIDGNSAVREVDPGGEIVFNGNTFRTQNLGVALGYWFSSRDGLSLGYSLRSVDWEVSSESPEYKGYDYTDNALGLSWMHQLSPTMVTDVRYRYSENEPDAVEDQFKTFSTNEITVGFRGAINDYWDSEIRFGYMQSDFSRASEAVPGFEDFSGFIVEGNISRELAHDSRLRLDLLHKPFVSSSGNNAYYTASGGRLLYDWMPGRFFGQARIGYQKNAYEDQPVEGRAAPVETIMIYGVGIGYRLTQRLSTRLSAVSEERDLDLAVSSESKVYSVDLIFGF